MRIMYDAAHTMGFESLKGFRLLGPADRDEVAQASREQRFDAGVTIFSEGQPAEYVWAVKDGLVHLIKRGPEGREIVLEVIPPGELIGAVVALEGKAYPVSAVAAEPSVLWKLPAAAARGLAQKHPTLRATILDQATTRLRSAHDRLRSIALERTEQRLARMLLVLADKIGRKENDVLVVNVTRRELADMIGATVETTIRLTSKWQQAGLVHSARHQLGLLNRSGLERIASGRDSDPAG